MTPVNIMAKKQKYQVEFQMHSSPKILYNYLINPNGLDEWFADSVNVKDGIYTFKWEGSEAKAKMIHKRDGQMVKFKWLDDPDDAFFVADQVAQFAKAENYDIIFLGKETIDMRLTQMINRN